MYNLYFLIKKFLLLINLPCVISLLILSLHLFLNFFFLLDNLSVKYIWNYLLQLNWNSQHKVNISNDEVYSWIEWMICWFYFKRLFIQIHSLELCGVVWCGVVWCGVVRELQANLSEQRFDCLRLISTDPTEDSFTLQPINKNAPLRCAHRFNKTLINILWFASLTTQCWHATAWECYLIFVQRINQTYFCSIRKLSISIYQHFFI